MSTQHKVWFLLIALYGWCVLMRALAVQGGNFPFWWDSGRDAVISREIIEKGDLKTQGPSASGTNDTVYHGVLHFYIIGPAYTLLGGDPRLVIIVLAAISSLAVFPIFGLARRMIGSLEGAFLAVFLYGITYEAIRLGTWMSNPFLTALSIPLFFYFLWRVFYEKHWKSWLGLGLALALSQQAVIFFVTLWGVVVLLYLIQAQDKRFRKEWSWKWCAAGIGTYVIGILPMILTQLKLWRAGVFSPTNLSSFADRGFDLEMKNISGIIGLYLPKLLTSILPSYPIVALILLVLLVVWARNRLSERSQVFAALWLTMPVWLLGWHYRPAYHSLAGIEALAVIVLGGWLSWLKPKYLGVALVSLGLLVYAYGNYKLWQFESQTAHSVNFVLQGTYFHHQLAALDYTYRQAQGRPFSISTVTNPFGINTLWAYLFSWYGQQQYGYLPDWYGPDQTGLFGGDLLKRTETPHEVHFSIWEPGGIPDHLYRDFAIEQDSKVGPAAEVRYFGTLKVDRR